MRFRGGLRGRTVRAVIIVAAAMASIGASACSSTATPPAQTPPTVGAAPGSTTNDTSGSSGAPPATKAELVTTTDAFYAVPTPIPDLAHGTLVKYEEVTPTSATGTRTYRIMYSSQSIAGQPIVVTGVALVPLVAAPAEGRVTLTIAHGTTGIADACAPSKSAKGAEISGMGPTAAQGWLVALTDYEGMGTPGRHPYLVGESEGRSVIDAALAARSLPGADAGNKLAIAGYSQGGHGALWAGEVAPKWAPDLKVVGTFAGAPATENDVILKAAARLPINGFSFMMIAGYHAAYPEADPAQVLTPAGLAKLDAVDTGCTADVFKATAGPPGELFRTEGTDNPPWSTLMAANNPGAKKVDSPVLIIHSDDDQTVPVGLSEKLHDRMCKNGQVVERRVLAGAGGHVRAAVPAYVAALVWLQDMAAGKTPMNDCSSLKTAP